jgi:hypothetical protein
MLKLYLLATASVVTACGSALAAPEATLDLHRSTAPAATHQQQRAIPERPVQPALAANAAFGEAVENALAKPGASNLTDPTGKFAIRVMPEGNGRVVLVTALGTNKTREWKIGAGAGDLVLSATMSEIMSATGQHVDAQLHSTGTGNLRAFSGK